MSRPQQLCKNQECQKPLTAEEINGIGECFACLYEAEQRGIESLIAAIQKKSDEIRKSTRTLETVSPPAPMIDTLVLGKPLSEQDVTELMETAAKEGYQGTVVVVDDPEIALLIEPLVRRIRALEAAILWHRSRKGHDRCWENDNKLYSVFKGHQQVDPELPPRDEFRRRCQEYEAQQYEVVDSPQRQEPGSSAAPTS